MIQSTASRVADLIEIGLRGTSAGKGAYTLGDCRLAHGAFIKRFGTMFTAAVVVARLKDDRTSLFATHHAIDCLVTFLLLKCEDAHKRTPHLGRELVELLEREIIEAITAKLISLADHLCKLLAQPVLLGDNPSTRFHQVAVLKAEVSIFGHL
uniref:Uncharacterized protein n=1 Tax=Coccolithus braarudii TaxID=221442 RepID=A0A7S0LB59_9EUKA|mmetsp:Transcript_30430/g.65398  ORF Transcript_30430/g.65398 Transcript_30430/m.65398 type:complete len:153 (+) Transcript_30430:456-914(+)